jgi:hypothetical protein
MALPGHLAEVYCKLWNLSDEVIPPCRTLYQLVDQMPGGPAQRALFMTHLDSDGDEPVSRIWIARSPIPPDCAKPDLGGATPTELIALALERGHERSHRNGTYVENDQPGAMGEQNRAWNHAADILRALGFGEWDAFREAKALSLAIHRSRGTPA